MRVLSAEECPQLSDLWWSARCGRPTASNFDRIMTPKKRTASKGQEKYIAELLADLTSQNPPYFTQNGRPTNTSMEWGRNTEDEAVRFYEMTRGVSCTRVGMCITDDDRFSCSPDSLVEPDGALECKCPERQTHMLYLMKDEVPLEYLCQCHGTLIVTGRKWIDFLSYCHGAPALIKRIEPDSFTLALRMHLELFDVKFQAAKEKFKVGQKPEDEPLTDLTKRTVEEFTSRLAQLEAAMPDRGFQYGMDSVNSWIKDMQDTENRPPIPYQTKREVWRLLSSFAARQDPAWFFDPADKAFRLDVP